MRLNMALKITKESTHKTKFKQKCEFSSTNETLQFLECEFEDPWKLMGNKFKGIQILKLELINLSFQSFPPMIASTLIGAILHAHSWVHKLIKYKAMHALI